MIVWKISLIFRKIYDYGKQESFRFQGKTTEKEEIIWQAGRKIEAREGEQSVEPEGEIRLLQSFPKLLQLFRKALVHFFYMQVLRCYNVTLGCMLRKIIVNHIK